MPRHTMAKQAREFIRHPTDIPIEVSLSSDQGSIQPRLSNISEGGLAFIQDRRFSPGAILQVRIPFIEPQLKVNAQVVWCEQHGSQFEIGVRFLEWSDAYKVRMVEQVCHIEQYKRHVERTEGRRLSGEEAASEWIEKFASEFPSIH